MATKVKVRIDTEANAKEIKQYRQEVDQLLDTLKLGVGIDLGGKLVSSIGLLPGAIKRMVQEGVAFNSTLEQSKLGIAAVLKQFQPEKFANFNDALVEAGRGVDLLKVKAKESSASFESLLEAFQATSGAQFAGGINNLQQQIQLVLNLSQAVKGLGLPDQQVASETRAILTGQITANAQAAKVFGITAEDVAKAKEAGQLYEFITRKVSAFAEAGVIGTQSYAVALSNLGDSLQQIKASLTESLFEALRSDLLELNKTVNSDGFKDGFRQLIGDVMALVGVLASMVKWAAENTAGLSALAGVSIKLGVALGTIKVANTLYGLVSLNLAGPIGQVNAMTASLSALNKAFLAVTVFLAAFEATRYIQQNLFDPTLSSVGFKNQNELERTIELTKELNNETEKLNALKVEGVASAKFRTEEIKRQMVELLNERNARIPGILGSSTEKYGEVGRAMIDSRLALLEIELRKVQAINGEELKRLDVLKAQEKSRLEAGKELAKGFEDLVAKTELERQISAKEEAVFRSQAKPADRLRLVEADRSRAKRDLDALRLTEIPGDKSGLKQAQQEAELRGRIVDLDQEILSIRKEISAEDEKAKKQQNALTAAELELKISQLRLAQAKDSGIKTNLGKDEVSTLDILSKNKDKNFVDRILNADQYPKQDNGDGSFSTHLMASAEVDGKNIAFPTLFYDKKNNKLYAAKDAVAEALATGDYIEFGTGEEAEKFASGSYKVGFDKGKTADYLERSAKISERAVQLEEQSGVSRERALKIARDTVDAEEELTKLTAQHAQQLRQEEIEAQRRLSGIESEITLLRGDPFQTDEQKRLKLFELLQREREELKKTIDAWRAYIEANQDSEDPQVQQNVQDRIDRLAQASQQIAQIENEAKTLTFNGGIQSDLTNWVNSFGTTSQQVSKVITGTLGSAIDGISNGITGLINGTMTWRQAMQNTVSSIIANLVQIVVQMVVMNTVGKMLTVQNQATQVTAGATIAAANAPAAAATSIASFGGSATAGLVAATAAIALIIGMLALGGGGLGFEEGGLIPGAPSHSDNRVAMVASGEFVARTAAVQHYGPGLFAALNSMSIPRDWFHGMRAPAPACRGTNHAVCSCC